jgi:hypothetical protein
MPVEAKAEASPFSAEGMAAFLRPHRARYALLLPALGDEELLFGALAAGCRAASFGARSAVGGAEAPTSASAAPTAFDAEAGAVAAMLDAYMLNLHLLVDYPAEDHCPASWLEMLNPFAYFASASASAAARAQALPLARRRIPRAAAAALSRPYPETQRAVAELFNADLGAAHRFHAHYNNYLAFAAASFAVVCGSCSGGPRGSPFAATASEQGQGEAGQRAMEAFLELMLCAEAGREAGREAEEAVVAAAEPEAEAEEAVGAAEPEAAAPAH